MTHLPESVANAVLLDGEPAPDYLGRRGLNLVHQGKVRDTYSFASDPDRLLVIATDRISIFDFVLPRLIPGKGEVLTALTHFWLTVVLARWPNHLVRSRISPRYNAAYDLHEDYRFKGFDFPSSRALVVKRLVMQPYELIYRGHAGGSIWDMYTQTGMIGGHRMPEGLTRWSRLEDPVFTPSTKEQSSHDVNITAAEYFAAMGEVGHAAHHLLLDAYREAYAYAYERGIIILDTKFEAGTPFMIADEVLTPDSSRFTAVADFGRAAETGTDPIFYDKEPVREWGRSVKTPFGVTGINNLDPGNPDHQVFVDGLEVPSDIVYLTQTRYSKIFYNITGEDVEDYQCKAMGL